MLLLILAGLILAVQPALAADAGPVCGVYGFDPKSAAFKGKTPERIAEALSSWGVNAVFGGYKDPLLRKALRGRGIRVFAELTAFAGERHWKTRPESRPVSEVGEPLAKVKWYAAVCPNQTWLRLDIKKRAVSLVRKQEVDGVWLDFIRYPGHWEVPEPHLEQTCFCPVCLREFRKETGVAVPEELTAREKARWILSDHKERWTAFKTASIAGLVSEVADAVHAADPAALVGYFAVPWERSEKRGAVLEILGQDHRLMGRAADVVSPMAYHALLRRPASWITDASMAVKADSGKPVWPIIFVGDAEHPLGPGELRAAADAAWQGGSGGLILFDLGKLAEAGRLGELPALFSACLD
ncbi:MAG: hypothetical protein HY924_09100 [Elusimicrobia bacterium]|nr:hypothetical protein [Elusimicrobiota bacterium]